MARKSPKMLTSWAIQSRRTDGIAKTSLQDSLAVGLAMVWGPLRRDSTIIAFGKSRVDWRPEARHAAGLPPGQYPPGYPSRPFGASRRLLAAGSRWSSRMDAWAEKVELRSRSERPSDCRIA